MPTKLIYQVIITFLLRSMSLISYRLCLKTMIRSTRGRVVSKKGRMMQATWVPGHDPNPTLVQNPMELQLINNGPFI
ncbi:hypothetical protein Hanom_Chr14g01249161 [Helianthus anomalus]